MYWLYVPSLLGSRGGTALVRPSKRHIGPNSFQVQLWIFALDRDSGHSVAGHMERDTIRLAVVNQGGQAK